MEIKYGRRRMKGSENKMRTKVQMKWTSCHTPPTSSATVMYMALLSNTRLSSLKKENRREPFAFHPSFKSTFTAPATLPTYGRSVGRSVGTDRASFVQPQAVHIPAKCRKCIHDNNNNNFGRRERRNLLSTLSPIELWTCLRLCTHTCAHTHMRANMRKHAQTCAWTPHINQERLERRRGGRKENGSTTDVSSAALLLISSITPFGFGSGKIYTKGGREANIIVYMALLDSSWKSATAPRYSSK